MSTERIMKSTAVGFPVPSRKVKETPEMLSAMVMNPPVPILL
jgi:hypothetical protein